MVSHLKSKFVLLVALLFPLFFLPITQEFYNTNKFLLLAFADLVLILLSAVIFLSRKKITFAKSPIMISLAAFTAAVVLSLILSAPNKVEAVLHPIMGLGIFLALFIWYLLVSREQGREHLLEFLSYSSLILAIIQIVFFVNPLVGINLPPPWQFLKTPGFSPIGSQLDLVLFLGFFVLYEVFGFIKNQNSHHANRQFKQTPLIRWAFLATISIALSIGIFTILKGRATKEPITIANFYQATLLPPIQASWHTAFAGLKKPQSALLGAGPGNYTAAFTLGKTVEYNQTAFWQITFNQSRSFLLQILTETGILGLTAFAMIMLVFFYQTIYPKLNLKYTFLGSYLFFAFAIFPPSLPLLFLFFTMLAAVESAETAKHRSITIDLSEYIEAVAAVIVIIVTIIVIAAGYLLVRAYIAEYYFKKSINGVSQNKVQLAYDSLRRAIAFNPYLERFRIAYSQLNILLANNIVITKKDQLTDIDRQTIAQAIQQAISEGKTAVSLNSQKASHWENLGFIYRNITGVVQNAQTWAISSYQRAIALDPVNPMLRLNLGGIYYSIGDYAQAITLFDQAVNLKPNWANFHYNLAWAYYQSKQYEKAVSAMEKVLQLVSKGSPDEKKAEKELKEFEKSIDAKRQTTKESGPATDVLNLPQEPVASISPPLELPSEASPESAQLQ